MEFIPAPGVAQVEIRQRLFGQEVENVMYFKFDGATIPTPRLQTLALAVGNQWSVGILLLQSFEVSLREIYVTDLTTVTSPTYSYVFAPPGVGGSVANSEPGGTTLSCSFKTAVRGRSGRGRNYFIGVPRTQVVGNQVLSGFADAVTTAYNGFVGADNVDTDFTWCVLSRYSAGSPRPSGITFPVQSASVSNTAIDSQRRRLDGRGQ